MSYYKRINLRRVYAKNELAPYSIGGSYKNRHYNGLSFEHTLRFLELKNDRYELY
jgi:hypothetical protein